MPSLLDPTAYHILSYGTLLGTSIFNTFIAGIVSFKVLPRPNFSQLQQKLFPWYFGMQTLLPLVGLATYPIPSILTSPTTLTQGTSSLLSPSSPHFSSATLPHLAMAVLGLANWAWLGPWTTRVMRARKHQETRDGKKYDAPGEQSAAMARLNRDFSALHSASSLVNVVEIGVMIWYGFVLADRISVS